MPANSLLGRLLCKSELELVCLAFILKTMTWVRGCKQKCLHLGEAPRLMHAGCPDQFEAAKRELEAAPAWAGQELLTQYAHLSSTLQAARARLATAFMHENDDPAVSWGDAMVRLHPAMPAGMAVLVALNQSGIAHPERALLAHIY